jgi:hypothetical protein
MHRVDDIVIDPGDMTPPLIAHSATVQAFCFSRNVPAPSSCGNGGMTGEPMKSTHAVDFLIS